MADKEALLNRLRRLIDDAGNGHSLSSPGFTTSLVSTGFAAPSIGITIDGDGPFDVDIGPLEPLTTGNAIVNAIQRAVRNADPGLLLPEPVPTPGWAGFYCRFDRSEGYLLQSGSIGSKSEVHVTPATSGNDVTSLLRLGLGYGGFEDNPRLKYSDEELLSLIENGLDTQNRVGDITQWTFFTLPAEYDTIIVYRAWGDVVDMMIGQAANYYPQKVSGEEVAPNRIFENYMRLRKWLDEKIEELTNAIESRIIVTSVLRWDKYSGSYVGDNGYKPGSNVPMLLVATQGEDNTEVVLEYASILTLDSKLVYVGYRESEGVFDRSALTEESFFHGDKGNTVLASGSILARTIRQTKNTLVKITGLTPGVEYFFGLQVIDQNGNRYFSNELSVILE